MTNDELEANVKALAAHGLTALFERIADAGTDGLKITRALVLTLCKARLVTYARGLARLTDAGWEVSTRIAAHACKASIAARGPSPFRAAEPLRSKP